MALRSVADSALRIGAVAMSDLRVLSRGRWWWAFRLLFVLVLVVVVYFSWPREFASTRDISRYGSTLFMAFFVTAYLCVALLTPALFSGAIASDQRNHTLEILFTTPLPAFEIVAGKFLSHYALLLQVLACGVPILFSSLVFGGVSGTQTLLAGLSLLLLGLLLGSATLIFSAGVDKPYLAALMVYLFGGITLLVAPQVLGILAAVMAAFSPGFPWLGLMGLGMPHVALAFIPFEVSGMTGVFVFLTCLESVLLGVGFLVWAGRSLKPKDFKRPIARRRPFIRTAAHPALTAPPVPSPVAGPADPPSDPAAPPDAKAAGTPETPPAPGPALPAILPAPALPAAPPPPAWKPYVPPPKKPPPWLRKRTVLSRYRGPVWDNPVAWKETIADSSVLATVEGVVGVALLCYFAVMAGLVALAASGNDAGAGTVHVLQNGLLMGEILLAALVAVTLAGTAMGKEGVGDIFDTLAVTPLCSWDVFIGKFSGLLRAMAPLLVFAGVHLLALLAVHMVADPWTAFAAFLPTLFLLLCIAFLGSMSLFFSLLAKTPSAGMTASLAVLLGLWVAPPVALGLLEVEGGVASWGFNPLFGAYALHAALWPGVLEKLEIRGLFGSPGPWIPAAMTVAFLVAGTLAFAAGFQKLYDRRAGRA